MIGYATQVKHADFYAATYNNNVLQMGFTMYHKNDRSKRQKFENIRDVGMKKAQKHDIIQNGTVFGILYPFLHSTQYIIVKLWLACGKFCILHSPTSQDCCTAS